MFWLLVFGVIALGLVFILVDILFIPGTFVGIIGGLILVYGVYLAYTFSSLAGTLTLLSTIVLLVLGLYLAMRSKTWNKVKLNTAINSKVDVNIDAMVEVGDVGICLSRLMPMGKARFNNFTVEVASIEGPVDTGQEIEIVKIESNKIFVKPKN